MHSCHPKFTTCFIPEALHSWRGSSFNNASASLRSQRRGSLRHGQFLAECSGPHDQQTARAVSTEFETITEKEENVSGFDWFKNWWMVQAVDNLKTDRPNKIKLLNRDFIVWKGHSGEWIAMDDECPHRLAPLSEGRIEKDGNLLCSYHAWRFNESGKCVKIPHADDEKAHSVACNSSRSAVQTYPCKARGALLWIWPDSSVSAFSDAENSSIPIDDDLADYIERVYEEGVFVPFVMKFPVSFESVVENVLDPAHVQVTHHGALPIFSRYDAAPIHSRLTEKISDGRGSINLKYSTSMSENEILLEVKLPGACFSFDKATEKVPASRAYMACTPVSRRESLFAPIMLTEPQITSTKKANIIQRALSPLVNLAYHFYVLYLSDADVLLLSKQGEKTTVEGFEAKTGYYVPTDADIGAMAFRRWFETAGQNGAAYRGNDSTETDLQLSREQLMNRFEHYTKHCKLGSSALKITETAISVLKFMRLSAAFMGSVFLLRAINTAPVSFSSVLKNVPFIVSLLVLCCSIATIRMLNKLRSQFYYRGYDFAEKN